MITVVGLGTAAGELSLKGLAALKRAQKVLVRNASPVNGILSEEGISFQTLDEIYEKSRNFDTLAKNLAKEVRKQAEGVDLCYCVEGGVSEDRAAQILLQKGDVAVIEGVSKAAKAAAQAGLCGAYTAVSAYELSERKLTLPLVVYDLDHELLAGDVKLLLTERFGDEAEAMLLNGERADHMPLYEIDRAEEYTSRTTLVVFDQPLLEKKRFDLDDFLAILRRLRAPDGCPWDRAQTHESIRINLIEEAYELVDAIDLMDSDKMREEAGDVLMQAAFHTLIEEEKGNFTMTDVLTEVCEKLITRHTHVFGTDKAAGADGALSVWDKNKMAEKHQVTFSDSVNDVPEGFPALLRAQKVCKRMSKGGWAFLDFDRNVQKLNEEVNELKAAYEGKDEAHISEELGDVLMCIAWLGRTVGAECEQALLDAVKKVQKRYNAFESAVLADGKDVQKLSEGEWNEYYRRAKEDVARS